MRTYITALAPAALFLSLSAGAVQAQSPSLSAQMSYRQMLNQQDMMRRSQQFQLMRQAHEAQEAESKRRAAAQAARSKKSKAAAGKPKQEAKPAGMAGQGAGRKR
jgi:hypothetical protein